jgi:hypothetical protein
MISAVSLVVGVSAETENGTESRATKRGESGKREGGLFIKKPRSCEIGSIITKMNFY